MKVGVKTNFATTFHFFVRLMLTSSLNDLFVKFTFCCAFRAICGDKNSILELNESN